MVNFSRQPWFNYVLIFVLGGLIVFWGGQVQQLTHSVQAQSILRPEDAARMVYEKLPDIPLENQYVRKDSGQVDPDHTLISRVIRYHRDVQRRAMQYRFDWKLTLADYLGINQPVREERYPGSDTLTQNPWERDLKIINQFNRRQRLALVDLLADIYGAENPIPPARSPQTLPSPDPSSPQPTPTSKPPLSQPGDAQLLMP